MGSEVMSHMYMYMHLFYSHHFFEVGICLKAVYITGYHIMTKGVVGLGETHVSFNTGQAYMT